MKVNILRANFTIQTNCPMQNYFISRPLTPNLTLLANEETRNFLRSQQTNRRSRKQLFRINCPITNLWNRQTVSRQNFFPWKTSKNSSSVKSKKRKEENKVRYVFFEFQSFCQKLVKPEKSQTYLVCIRIKCSVVSTSVLFEETKLNANTSSLLYSSSR